MSKAKVISAPVAAKVEAKKDAEFLSFYNKASKEKQTPIVVVTDPTGKIALCEIEFSNITQWNKDAEKADFSYIKIEIRKRKVVDGEFEEVKGFVIGHNEEKNTKWVMVTKPEGEVAKPVVVSC